MGRVAIITVKIITIVLALVTFGLSCWESGDELKNFTWTEGSCSNLGGPMRATIKGGSLVQCGWSTTRTAVRLLYLLIFFIMSALYFIAVFKRSTKLYIVSIIIILGVGVMGFYSFIADGRAASNGNDFCKNSFKPTIVGIKVDYECEPGRFYGVTAISVLTVVLMFAMAIVSFFKRNTVFGAEGYKTEI
ncbi:hypothetical protein DICPUDRAFT_152242 [Dictyostelium purpureum]|uniref:MARVEL domain-containing protein n=1 Tax=Dictyostelium purpureum TaxID=5786 RepID=F0ZKU7_DICPU|nr:uncharacterized protein DICPUDRAFT_152242 [Dictyostelium purpureum]EGC35422.1 hypothetical protein DICPUDRAFT_152242 [Dictyostelium purpureum]|eukprot:XP_003288035.1 hypothetical protein DICPUDRAFT_152242 [Dictyostelium purpureum]